MTRRTAREIAMHLSFATVMNRMDIGEMLDDFFDPEYFASLGEEDQVYAEYPDEKQLAYIREHHEPTLALYDAYCEEAEKRGFWLK